VKCKGDCVEVLQVSEEDQADRGRGPAWILIVIATVVTAAAGVASHHQMQRLGAGALSAYVDVGVLVVAGLTGALVAVGLRDRRQHRKLLRLQVMLDEVEQLLQTLPALVMFQDGEGRVLGANAAFWEYLGVAGEQVIGRPVVEVLEAYGLRELVAAIEQRVSGAWQKTQPTQEQLVIQHPTRGEQALEVVKVPLFDRSGRRKILAVIGLDVTDQRRIAAELQETEEKYIALLENNPDGVVVLDGSAVVTSVNFAAEVLAGVPRKRLQGMHLGRWNAFGDGPAVEKHLTAAREGEPQFFETGWVHPQLGKRNVSVKMVPMGHPDEQQGVFLILRDVTMQHHANEELRTGEARYRLITENMTDIIGSTDPDGTMTYLSPSSAATLGIYSDSLIGRHLTQLVYSEDQPLLGSRFQEVVATSEPRRAECRLLKDGELRTLEIALTPVTHPSGPQSVIVVIREVTDRKRTEEQFRKSDKLAAVGQLAAGVAHEIRNPLTSLKGFLQVMRGQSDKHQNYLDIMWEDVLHIETIVTEFLKLSKSHPIHLKDESVPKLLQEVSILLEAESALHDVQVVTYVKGDIPPLQCDEHLLKHAFLNVGRNAIESMPNGGDLTITMESIDRDAVRVRFEDHGVGISDEHLPRLGEPFFTTKDHGVGIGLMVTQKIVEAHRGLLAIHSRSGIGTTVDITLPVTFQGMTGFAGTSASPPE